SAQTFVLPDTGEPEQATFIKAASLPNWQSHQRLFHHNQVLRQPKDKTSQSDQDVPTNSARHSPHNYSPRPLHKCAATPFCRTPYLTILEHRPAKGQA